ncbi:hypothetical protein DT603_10900 [Pseudoxanthomonas gei]|uniref:Uncharacterized protein n=1 Tax=Pseudoxanthomonas gei TaxID=1383030 RepID=A0ABX0ACN9_9GAMM|nr:hypothetical protein [Pseudoxanthomonas gei]NDK39350.1 hypothetical protein [Pseudoxanthomonas gei]
MFKPVILAALCLGMAACRPAAPVQPVDTIVDLPSNGDQAGALSGGPPPAAPVKAATLESGNWPVVEVSSGEAFVSCAAEPEEGDPGHALHDLSYASVSTLVRPCIKTGIVRLRYQGKIATDFTALVERVAHIAERLRIETRILDLDSSGGHVEDAMKAGDAIGATRWLLWVREDAICHSACVLILAAGDDRRIAGKVGIHRMIRVDSIANTRAEVSQELREVYAQMKDYLERNGAAVAVADLMMTVPNRKLRLLARNELEEYGLDGANAVQDDLERIRLTRKCGEDFVGRKDEFTRVFERECVRPDTAPEQVDACGLALRADYGFPDGKCPIESPLSQHDNAGTRPSDQSGHE